MEIVPLKKICSTLGLGRKKHEKFLGFHVFMFSCFFLPCVEQLFLEVHFPFKFLVLFASRKNLKTQKTRKPENLKTQKLIQKNT